MAEDRTISIIVNVDTRPGWNGETTENSLMMDGARSVDFLTEGIHNKRKFFEGFPIEVTLFIDLHEDLPWDTWHSLASMTKTGILDNLVVHRHTKRCFGQDPFYKFNDINFLNALMMGRGEYIVHFDGDMSAFRHPDDRCVKEWLDDLDSGKFSFISYPSPWSPSPDGDNRWDYYWASTRFFICRRDTLDFTEIIKCLLDDEHLYGKYGEKYRRCPWLEHILGIIAGPGKVFYPPYAFERYLIFCWSRYYKGTLNYLNNIPFERVRDYVYISGGIQYPCDVKGLKAGE